VKCTALPLAGAHLIDFDPSYDIRGYYATTWCAREVRGFGLSDRIVQSGTSFNRKRGTIRGMHFQAGAHAQIKFVRCSRGAMYDVIIDLRPDSATYCRWIAVELSASQPSVLYVPEGFAHGFQTLADDTEVTYQMSEYYHPPAERGVRWNDSRFGIPWPVEDVIISDKDRGYPDFTP
jgi:dTDP-4-dehydrorhamnose 3,5-epimerase